MNKDNGSPYPKKLTTGYGIKSVYDKLDLLFPDKYKIEIEMEMGGWKNVRIVIS